MTVTAVLDQAENALISGSAASIQQLEHLLPELEGAHVNQHSRIKHLRRLVQNLHQFLSDFGIPCSEDGAEAYNASGLRECQCMARQITLG